MADPNGQDPVADDPDELEKLRSEIAELRKQFFIANEIQLENAATARQHPIRAGSHQSKTQIRKPTHRIAGGFRLQQGGPVAIVNGSLKDIVNASMTNRQGKLVFRLNAESVAVTGANAGAV